MAIDLTALGIATTAATALSNLILVNPQDTIGYQPQNPTGDGDPVGFSLDSALGNVFGGDDEAPSFLFDYEGEQSALIESDITDHYIEDNTAIQDQIALKPVTITTRGFIGEVNDIVPELLAPLKKIADKLTVLTAYTPEVTTTAQIAYSEALLLYQVARNAANSAIAAWNSLTGQGGESVINGTAITVESNQTKQQAAFQQFYGWWASRTLFTVQTPWAIFEDMAIKSLRAVQDEQTRVITNFEVTFKQIRIAGTITESGVQSSLLSNQANTQSKPGVDGGTSSGEDAEGIDDGVAETEDGG